MIKFLFFQFRITYLNLKNIELHFELLTQSRLMLEIQFYFCPLHLDVHQSKTSPFVWSPTISKLSLHHNQLLFSAFVF